MIQQKEFFPLDWYKAQVVRYGNIDTSHPSHFLYAVYDCFQNFRSLNQKDKQSFIENKRVEFSKLVSKKEWSRLASIQIILDTYIESFQEGLKTENSSSRILQKIIKNPTHFFADICEEVVHQSHIESFINGRFKKCLEKIEKEEKKKIDEVKKQKCCDLFHEYHENIFQKVESQLFQDFQHKLADPLVSIDSLMMICIMYVLPVNIIFIDKDIRSTIVIDADYFIFSSDRKDVQNIFLLYTYPFCFESIGVADLPNDGSTPKQVKIRKLFSFEHDFVQTAIDRL